MELGPPASFYFAYQWQLFLTTSGQYLCQGTLIFHQRYGVTVRCFADWWTVRLHVGHVTTKKCWRSFYPRSFLRHCSGYELLFAMEVITRLASAYH